MADVSTYRTTIDGRLRATDGDDEIRVTVSGTASSNVTSEEMLATARAEGETGRTYITNRTVYAECRVFGWGRENLTTSGPWWQFTPAGQQLALLNATPAYWHGTRTVDGTETVLVSARPTKEELQDVPGTLPATATELDEVNLKRANVTLWLDAESHRPVQVKRTIVLGRGDTTANARVTMRFEGYGEPTPVTEPEIRPDEIRRLGCT